MGSIRIKKFDPRAMKEHRITFLIGKRHTGKSRLMIDLLYHMPTPDFVLAFAPTEDTLETLRAFVPPCCIYADFTHSKLERLLAVQRELIRQGKRRSVLLIMDDCLYQKGVLRSVAMRDLFFNGRHLNVGLICACQYLMDIGPEMRTNIDYLFSMRESTISNRQKLHKFFFGQFARFVEFDRVMNACTQSYSALTMDATIATTKSEECIFWYRASMNVPEFRLGRPVIWKLSERYQKSDEEVRKAQSRTFRLQTVAEEPTEEPGRGGKGNKRSQLVVETEDENGEIVLA